jgi:hypothetical protein
VISDVDVAARVGDQQFALLLEGPVTAADAQLCATHVVARGLRESPVLPAGMTLRLQVAAAFLPAEPVTAEQTLAWVLGAANTMPVDSPKSIRTLNF